MRPAATDFLHNMRFHVFVTTSAQTNILGHTADRGTDDKIPEGGFTACSIPDLTVEAVEYKEGTYVYPMKFPGNPAVGDCTMSRGVIRSDTTMWEWALSCVEGSALFGNEYRGDVYITHYHRSQYIGTGTNRTYVDVNGMEPARTYECYNCFPTSCKPAADLDATSSDISVQEMTVAVERMKVSATSTP